ncbi:MAG: hypothetical protein AAF153_02930, partial [Pseudomonadota bacterium]
MTNEYNVTVICSSKNITMSINNASAEVDSNVFSMLNFVKHSLPKMFLDKQRQSYVVNNNANEWFTEIKDNSPFSNLITNYQGTSDSLNITTADGKLINVQDVVVNGNSSITSIDFANLQNSAFKGEIMVNATHINLESLIFKSSANVTSYNTTILAATNFNAGGNIYSHGDMYLDVSKSNIDNVGITADDMLVLVGENKIDLNTTISVGDDMLVFTNGPWHIKNNITINDALYIFN